MTFKITAREKGLILKRRQARSGLSFKSSPQTIKGLKQCLKLWEKHLSVYLIQAKGGMAPVDFDILRKALIKSIKTPGTSIEAVQKIIDKYDYSRD